MEYSAAQYLLDDLPRTLFPLGTTRVLVERGQDLLYEYIYKYVLADPRQGKFSPQLLCYAAKQDFHLRRTLRLDPSAELFIYDLVYRNRTRFRRDHVDTRRNFGYRFNEGRPISPMTSYREFRATMVAATRQFKYAVKLDIALYFNSIYHHDLVAYFAESGWVSEDVAHLGLFLREINSGRSIDCLPQGLNPCKVLGAEFLKFVDNSARLRSPLVIRFLDDIHIFSDTRSDLIADQLTIQQLIGEKGLSLNSAKTQFSDTPLTSVEEEVDEMKRGLLDIRQQLIQVSGEDVVVEVEERQSLTAEQTEYLLALVRDPELDESDAELVLTLLTERAQEVLEHLAGILPRFPSLAKTLFAFLAKTDVREGLADVIVSFIEDPRLPATEYQLFWLAAIAEQYLSTDPKYGQILMRLYEHRGATNISQARVLEIPEHRFGMPEMRAELLRSGQSNWLAWGAAAGCRKQAPAARNHLLSYFANVSPLNQVIAKVVQRYEPTP